MARAPVALAAVAFLLGVVASIAFVSPPSSNTLPRAQLRSSVGFSQTGADAREPSEDWQWSASSLLSMGAAFGLLLGVALGPQPASAMSLSERLKCAQSPECKKGAEQAKSRAEVLDMAFQNEAAKMKKKEEAEKNKAKAEEVFMAFETKMQQAPKPVPAPAPAPAPAATPSGAPTAASAPTSAPAAANGTAPAAGKAAADAAREAKIEAVRQQVLKNLETRKAEAAKQAREAEELAKRLEVLAAQARATADATKLALGDLQ